MFMLFVLIRTINYLFLLVDTLKNETFIFMFRFFNRFVYFLIPIFQSCFKMEVSMDFTSFNAMRCRFKAK